MMLEISTQATLGANTDRMGRVTAIMTVLLLTSIASAQAKVDRVPAIDSPPVLPVRPVPSEEVSDAPAGEQARPDMIQQNPDPPTRLVSGTSDSDTLKSHILPYAGIGYTAGFGNIDTRTPMRGTLASGPELSVGLGYGLSRNVDIGIGATLAPLSGGGDCPDCSARSMNAVAYIGYHLVQGTRFDPWVRFGAGVSALHLSTPLANFNYVGVSWTNATVGGDWYATRHFGIGPVISLAFHSYVEHPKDRSTSIAETLTASLRLTFDAGGR
jgi:hypothetical protein